MVHMKSQNYILGEIRFTEEIDGDRMKEHFLNWLMEGNVTFFSVECLND